MVENKELREFSRKIQLLREEKAKMIIGQEKEFQLILVCLFSWGLEMNFHVLFESVPGLGKTKLVKTLAKTLGIKFSRIQMTPDLLPSDISGYEKINPRSGEVTGIKEGPIFTNLLLIDEINRASPKTQSALLEAMQEGQVTIGDKTLILEQPFLLMATQNPLEHSGTKPLGAAELDRFVMKVNIDYPTYDEEIGIIEINTKPLGREIGKIIGREEILKSRELIRDAIYFDQALLAYIAKLVRSTRPTTEISLQIPEVQEMVEKGASPRASIFLKSTSKVWAFLEGRDYVTPEDIEKMAGFIFPHRIFMNPGYSEEDARRLVEILIERTTRNGRYKNQAKGT